MRTKKVVYQDLFNPQETREAPNKILLGFFPRLRNRISQFNKDKGTDCRCHHPRFDGVGVCCYRTCRHKPEDHYQAPSNFPKAWRCTNCGAELQMPADKINERIECVCGADMWVPLLKGQF